MIVYGRAIVSGDHWQIIPGASGTGGLDVLTDYVRRAMSGELRNVDIWREGTADEYAVADIYVLDWSQAP